CSRHIALCLEPFLMSIETTRLGFSSGSRGFIWSKGSRSMGSLPFSISVFAGLGRADGLVRLEGSSLVLEFQVQDRALGVLKSELKELRIPNSEIKHMELKTGWLARPRLCVQTETMRVYRQIPGSRHGTFELNMDNGHEL